MKTWTQRNCDAVAIEFTEKDALAAHIRDIRY
jgi:hypothetical protein